MLLKAKIKGTEMVIGAIEDCRFVGALSLMKKDTPMRYPNLFMTSGDLDVPFLVSTSSKEASKIVDVLSSTDSVSDEIFSQLYQILKSQLPIDENTIREIHNEVIILNSYVEGNYNIFIDFPTYQFKNTVNTQRLVDDINSKVSGGSIKDNKTRFREVCSDELFIKLPSPDTLALHGTSDSIMPLNSVFIPYSDSKMNTPEYKNYLNSAITAEYITGIAENVTEEVLDEERRFYDALVSLHKSCLALEYPDNTFEQCLEHNISSKSFRSYLIAYILYAASYNWNHSGFMPIGYMDLDNDDEDSDDYSPTDSDGSDVKSSKSMFANRRDKSDGEMILSSIIEKEFEKNILFPINIFIQMLRFGDKKPSKIKLFNDNSFFDLNTFMFSKTNGSYSSFEVKKTPTGCDFSIMGTVYSNNRIQDNRYIQENSIKYPIIDCPIGFVLKKEFVGTEEVQVMIISIIDFINWYGKDDLLTVEGVSLSGSELVVDSSTYPDVFLLDELSKISLGSIMSSFNKSSDGKYISYVSKYMKNVYIEFNSYSNKLSSMGLYNNIVERDNLLKQAIYNAVSSEEVEFKSTEYQVTPRYVLDTTVGLSMVRFMARVNDFFNDLEYNTAEPTIQDVLAIYRKVMSEQSYMGQVYFDGSSSGTLSTNTSSITSTSKVFSEPVSKVISDETHDIAQSISLFESRTFKEVIPVVLTQEEYISVEKSLSDSKTGFKLQNLGTIKGNIKIGYLGRHEGKFYLLSPEDRNYTQQSMYLMHKFKKTMLQLLRLVVKNKPSKVLFEDGETFNYYCVITERLCE